MIKVINDDILNWCKEYSGEKFHALLSDPPYHLTSITKRFGKKGSAEAQYGKDGAFQRASKGFMGKEWDGGDVAFNPDTWGMLAEHLYDGAFGMVFASSRGWHRLAVAIEDAGLIIHPSIFGWVYGSGFPKATRVKDERFDGHRYGLQALKPALEPIIVFQKPYDGKPIDNITKTGAGTLNIDGARIGTDYIEAHGGGVNVEGRKYGNGLGIPSIDRGTNPHNGRWPSNFYVDQIMAEALDQQSGISKSLGGKSGHTAAYQGGYKEEYYGEEKPGFGDVGGASRFFFRVEEQLEDADLVQYIPKASTKEREAGIGKSVHPTVKPISLAKYLATLLLPPIEYAPRRLLVPFSGVSSEMIGASQAGWEEIVGIEKDEEYVNLAQKRIEYWVLNKLF